MSETLVMAPWEWQGGARECIMVIKESMRKQGYDYVEVWADSAPDVVHVHYCYPPKNVPNALYRGRT